ncbi:RNA polymerase I-specific transcription initiation factor rrn11 [Cladorrhinum sp. PSN259]|nr:RNA polymerase I-specific transcription initiation factor rrn11 [Cladorrhinum sp. PSN259]
MDRKRKRPPNLPSRSPSPSSPSHPNNQIINPLSHPPSTLRQFTLAGLSHDQPLPSKLYPGFPHRGATQPHRSTSSATASDPSDPAQAGNLNYTTGSEGDDEANLYTTGESDLNTYTTDTDADSAGGAPGVKKNKTKRGLGSQEKARTYNSRVGVLTATIKRCLSEGDIETAKWAFSLLVRSKVRGRKVDLRWERLWELGGEILMREGEPRRRPDKAQTRDGEAAGGGGGGEEKTALELQEEQMEISEAGRDDEGEGDEEDKDKKLAREQENLVKVKAYYECLIQQHPFSKQHPSSTGVVVEFYAALWSAEMEGVWNVHKRAVEKIKVREENPEQYEDEEGDEDMDDDEDVDMMDQDQDEGGNGGWDEERAAIKKNRDVPEHLGGLTRREIKLTEEKNAARLNALGKMLEIAERMDTVMETFPFNRDHELLRLRAMASLYLGDLYVPPPPRSEKEQEESKKARVRQRVKAKGFLDKIKEGGGELKEHDEGLWKHLESDDDDYSSEDQDDEEEEHTILPMFSSM